MTLSDRDREDLRQLEETLWREETRFDREYMEGILAPDFTEFGRSGQTYTRNETLAMAMVAINARLPLDEFAVRAIDGDTVLATYVSEVGDEAPQRANRSSIWSRIDGSWKLRFHQGTPRR
jgi:hypothetical protein